MRLLFFCFLCFAVSLVNAQEFGGEPASVKWKAISTDTVSVIYPSGLDSVAKRVATITSKE